MYMRHPTGHDLLCNPLLLGQADAPGEEAGDASGGPSAEQTLASIRLALSRMDEKVDRARGQAVQSADAAITRFANQYLEEHHSSFADLVCPPDLLRAIRSWEEGEPLPNFLFDLPPAATLTEAERERGRRLCARRCPLAAIATDGAPGACRRCTTIFTIKIQSRVDCPSACNPVMPPDSALPFSAASATWDICCPGDSSGRNSPSANNPGSPCTFP